MSDPVARLNAALEGRYAIERELGEGGMATVYLADDLKHERKVALKVLKPELAAVVGAERFLAEIKVTANLQHPHILPLHDSGEADGFLFYVMPYVEGESLRERLDREHQLPVEEAVRIATSVAGALDYAHRQGVIHRDVKPANLLIHDEQPVVSDFGIALAVSAGGGGRLTETGLSMGTPHYMSPEQATGDQHVGAATDIYALGCVLYEMLVGEPPYTGSTPQAILGKIITGEPDAVTEHRKSVPTNVAAAIHNALEKLPADRFTTAAALAQALGDPGFQYDSQTAPRTAVGARPRKWLAVASAAGALLFAAGFSFALLRPGAIPPSPLRSVVPLPGGESLALADYAPSGTGRPSLALSRDGTLLAYVAARDGVSRLFLQRLSEEFEAVALPGTEGALNPFFSPDGEWIGFFTPTELKKIAVRGGTPQTLISATYSFGATWAEDGTIIFSDAEGQRFARVDDDGVEVTPLFDLEGDVLIWPALLPDEQSLVATRLGGAFPSVVLVSLETGEREVLIPLGSGARYVPSGHLVYGGEGGLMALPFDASQLVPTGPATLVLENVRRGAYGSALQVAVSDDGLLAYVPGVDMGISTPVWVGRDGIVDVTPLPPARYGQLDLSPAGRQLVIQVNGTTADLWHYDFAPGTELALLTSLAGNNEGPIWSGDGRSVAFASDGGASGPGASTDGIFVQSIVGGEPQTLMEQRFVGSAWPAAWSGGGAIAFGVVDAETGWDIWVMPPNSSEPRPFIATPGAQYAGDFSPDGSWLTYFTDESGRMEVWVTDYPAGAQRTLLSTNAGEGKEPKWSPLGDEVFYRSDRSLYAVTVEVDSVVTPGTPRRLFEGPFVTVSGPEFDVDSDAQRFLMLREPDVPATTQIRLVSNWFEELQERAPN